MKLKKVGTISLFVFFVVLLLLWKIDFKKLYYALRIENDYSQVKEFTNGYDQLCNLNFDECIYLEGRLSKPIFWRDEIIIPNEDISLTLNYSEFSDHWTYSVNNHHQGIVRFEFPKDYGIDDSTTMVFESGIFENAIVKIAKIPTTKRSKLEYGFMIYGSSYPELERNNIFLMHHLD